MHTLLPIVTLGLITQPLPTLAPNKRSSITLKPLTGNKYEFKKQALTIYHKARTTAPLPGLYQLLSNEDKSTLLFNGSCLELRI